MIVANAPVGAHRRSCRARKYGRMTSPARAGSMLLAAKPDRRRAKRVGEARRARAARADTASATRESPDSRTSSPATGRLARPVAGDDVREPGDPRAALAVPARAARRDDLRATRFARRRSGLRRRSVLPARAGEVIRPYFLARTQRRRAHDARPARSRPSSSSGCSTSSPCWSCSRRSCSSSASDLAAANPVGVRRGEVGRRARRPSCRVGALVVLFVLAGDPGAAGPRDGAARAGRCRRRSPALIARIAEKFARGLGAIRRPGRLLRRARLVVSALAVDRARHLGGGGGVPASPCRSPDRFC